MYSLVDTGCLLLAVGIAGVVIVLPGLVLAQIFRLSGERDDAAITTGTVAGLAVLPLVDSLLTRFVGLNSAVAFTLGLGVYGMILLVRHGRKPSNGETWLVAIWLVVLIFEWIDFDVGGKLIQPLTIIDAVKHAATTQAIVDSGAPPRDAFFLRPESASYYYFFYTLTALVERIGGGIIDARAAVGGTIFWVGIGLVGLVRLAKRRAGLDLADGHSPQTLLIVAVLAVGGLDLIAVLLTGFIRGLWFADPMSWNEQVTNWSESLIWVPHHLTALIAAVTGLIALCDEPVDGVTTRAWWPRAILLAALCFASCFGLSVWVALALVGTVAIWGVALLAERRWILIGALACAGIIALVLALPQLIDIKSGRAPSDTLPIMPAIRSFGPIDEVMAPGPLRLLVRFVLLPVNYYAGFAAMVGGTMLLWRFRRSLRTTEFGRVLILSTCAGLFLGTFLRSTLFNNDLGWRVLLFAQLAGTVWTVAGLERVFAAAGGLQWRSIPLSLAIPMCVGWATTLDGLVSVRVFPLIANDINAQLVDRAPATERALRAAYQWAAANLPREAVLQHDPRSYRSFAFALYGRQRVAVSDVFGSLYGADVKSVKQRIATLKPLFEMPMPNVDVAATARGEGIDDLVVSDEDPIWARRDSFVWRARPVYASDRVRIISVASLGGAIADSR